MRCYTELAELFQAHKHIILSQLQEMLVGASSQIVEQAMAIDHLINVGELELEPSALEAWERSERELGTGGGSPHLAPVVLNEGAGAGGGAKGRDGVTGEGSGAVAGGPGLTGIGSGAGAAPASGDTDAMTEAHEETGRPAGDGNGSGSKGGGGAEEHPAEEGASLPGAIVP